MRQWDIGVDLKRLARRAVISAWVALAFAVPVSPAIGAQGGGPPGARPDLDTRAGDRARVSRATRRNRASLEGRLGREGFVETDPVSGAVRFAGRSDGFLACGKGDPARIALDYVRNRPEVFRLASSDLAALRLAARYRSPDGVTHLSWLQTVRGIPSYDGLLNVNVSRRGCVVNVSGAPVPGLSLPSPRPALTASQALAVAKRDVGGSQLAPRARAAPGPERRTAFSNGDRAGLVVFADPDGARLAWRVEAAGRSPYVFDEVVDAQSGRVLARQSLTDFASDSSIYDLRPAPGTRRSQDLAADPSWLDDTAGFTRLRGNNAHAYADVAAPDGVNAGEDVAASAGTDWVFPHSLFAPAGQACPAPGCTWNSADATTRSANRSEATTQLFYYVNRFHDHLLEPPIGFNEASHNFERVHTSAASGAGDAVLAESNDFAGTDNANMATSPDGFSPRMQMYFWTNPSLNSSDDAEIAYHEYTHGLTHRLVNNGLGGGLEANQSEAMGEGWSDWYAFDFLVGAGFRADSATPGQLKLGDYVRPGGIRREAMDCPVGPAVPGCPGTAGAGPGGFTYGDLGKVASGFAVHADGEIWSQTLWDLRTAVGSAAARELVTGGLRLSPPNPSYLDMRDAILQADVAAGGGRSDEIWETFAARGMGVKASTASAQATSAVEDFSLPGVLEPGELEVSDSAPGGDGDGFPEAGETVRVEQALLNLHSRPVTGVNGTLSSSTAGVTVDQPAAGYPATIPGRSTATNAQAMRATVPGSAACDSNLSLTLSVDTDDGPVTVPIERMVGAPTVSVSADVPKAIPDGDGSAVTSTLAIPSGGTVTDLDVAIEKLTHSWVGDLSITLQSPQGTTVTLMNRPGSGSFGASGNDFSDLILDDEASASIADIPSDNPLGGYTGRYRPDAPLSAFDSQEAQGTWTLTVRDHASQFAGMLHEWGLHGRLPGCSPPPPTPPEVSTGSASGVTSTGATLAGIVDPNGVETSYAFEYGTSTSYGTTTTPGSAGSGDNPVDGSAQIAALEPGTAYHFRMVALRAGVVVSVGDDATFTTDPRASVGGDGGGGAGGTSGQVLGGALIQGTPSAGAIFGPLVTFADTPRTIRLDRRNRIVFRFSAAPPGSAGAVSLATTSRVRISARRRVRFGSRGFTVPATGRVVVRKPVSRAKRRTLRLHGKLRVRATVTIGGKRFSRTFTLRPRRSWPSRPRGGR